MLLTYLLNHIWTVSSNHWKSPLLERIGDHHAVAPRVSGVFRISKGGPNFRWLLVLTQRGPNPKGAKLCFPNFSYGEQKNFLPKGPWLNGPPNTPLPRVEVSLKRRIVIDLDPLVVISRLLISGRQVHLQCRIPVKPSWNRTYLLSLVFASLYL